MCVCVPDVCAMCDMRVYVYAYVYDMCAMRVYVYVCDMCDMRVYVYVCDVCVCARGKSLLEISYISAGNAIVLSEIPYTLGASYS